MNHGLFRTVLLGAFTLLLSSTVSHAQWKLDNQGSADPQNWQVKWIGEPLAQETPSTSSQEALELLNQLEPAIAPSSTAVEKTVAMKNEVEVRPNSSPVLDSGARPILVAANDTVDSNSHVNAEEIPNTSAEIPFAPAINRNLASVAAHGVGQGGVQLPLQESEQKQPREIAPGKKQTTLSPSELLTREESRAMGFEVEDCVSKLQKMEEEVCKVSRMLSSRSIGKTQSWAARRAYRKLSASERDMKYLGMSMEKKAFAKKLWNGLHILSKDDPQTYVFSRCGKKDGDALEDATQRTAEQYCSSAGYAHSIYDIRKHLRNTLDSINKAIAQTNPTTKSGDQIRQSLEALREMVTEVGSSNSVTGAAHAFENRRDFDGILNQKALVRLPRAVMNTGKKITHKVMHPTQILQKDFRPEFDKETPFYNDENNALNPTELKAKKDPSTMEYMFGSKRAKRIQ